MPEHIAPAENEIPRWPPTGLAPDVFFSRLETCLQKNGYAVTVDLATYEIDYHLGSDEQRTGARAQTETCINEIDPTYLQDPPPLSDEQMRNLYPYIVARAECLADRGYPLAAMPSFDVFADSGGRFDPAGELARSGISLDQDDVIECRHANRSAWFAGDGTVGSIPAER